MEEEVGIEPNIVNPPYRFESRLLCPYSWENTEEGEHHVPHQFHSLSEAVPSLRPNINITPLPIVPVELSDDDPAFSDGTSFSNTIDLTELEISDLEALSHEHLHSKIDKSLAERPELTVEYLENIIASHSSLMLIVLDLLEQFYAQNDDFECRKLRTLLSKTLLSVKCSEITRGLSTHSRFQSKEEVVFYLTQRLSFLASKTSGLSQNMFIL